jgi:regulator of sigma E protease
VVKRQILIGYVEPDSPAARAGLKEQDELLKVGGHQLSTLVNLEDFSSVTEEFSGQTVIVTYNREGTEQTTQATLRSKQEIENSRVDGVAQKGYLGVSPAEFAVQRSTWSAPIVAAGFMKQVTELTFKGLGNAIAGLAQGDTEKASSQVSGVIGVGYILTKGSILGIQFILLVIAILSLTLAIMNVLPIPALDGGRLFVTLLFRVLKKPLTPRMEEWIHGTGFAVLMLLFVLISIVDIKRFF